MASITERLSNAALAFALAKRTLGPQPMNAKQEDREAYSGAVVELVGAAIQFATGCDEVRFKSLPPELAAAALAYAEAKIRVDRDFGRDRRELAASVARWRGCIQNIQEAANNAARAAHQRANLKVIAGGVA